MKVFRLFLVVLAVVSYIYIAGCGSSGGGGGGGGGASVYTLTLSASTEFATTEAFGEITVVPSTDSYQYSDGATVEMTASALNAAYMFSSWEGSVSGETSPKWITMDGNKSVLARFKIKPPFKYALITATDPLAPVPGSVLQSGSSPYDAGDIVTLTAEAGTGFVFFNWGGSLEVTAPNPTTITMNTTKDVIARFKPQYTLTVSIPHSGGGTVEPMGGKYAENTIVTLTASAFAGHVFTSWEGGATGSTNPITVTMTSNKNVTAHFSDFTPRLYLSNADGTTNVYVVNLDTETFETTIEFPAGSSPNGLVVSKDRSKLYVSSSNSSDKHIYAIDIATNTLCGTVDVTTQMSGPLTLTPDGTKILAPLYNRAGVAVVSTDPFSLSKIEEYASLAPTTGLSQQAVVDSSGTYAYISFSGNTGAANDSKIFKMRLSDNTFVDSIEATDHEYLYSLAISSDNSRIYAPDYASNSARILTVNTSGFTFGTTISIGTATGDVYGASVSSTGNYYAVDAAFDLLLVGSGTSVPTQVYVGGPGGPWPASDPENPANTLVDNSVSRVYVCYYANAPFVKVYDLSGNYVTKINLPSVTNDMALRR